VDLGQLLRNGRQHLLVYVIVLGLRHRRGRRRLARALAGRARALRMAAAPGFTLFSLEMKPHIIYPYLPLPIWSKQNM